MTRDAVPALVREGLSRRDFLERSGALIVAFSASGRSNMCSRRRGHSARSASHVGPDAARLVDRRRRRRRRDGIHRQVRARAGHAHRADATCGRGAVGPHLARHLVHVRHGRVRRIRARPPAASPRRRTSTKATWRWRARRRAKRCVQLASARLDVPAEQLIAADGVVGVARRSCSAGVGTAICVAGRKFNIPLDVNAKRKPSREWTVLGSPVPRLDMAAMATGAFEYVHNVRVPGMAPRRASCARLRSAPPSRPWTRGRSAPWPASSKSSSKENFVGVVAEKPWQAIQAASKLRVNWREAARLPAAVELLRSPPDSSRPATRSS